MTIHSMQYLNLSYLESLIGEDVETKMVILSTLLEEIPEELGKLQTTFETKDWNTFHEVSHKLKSTLAYVGYDEMFEANQAMMMSARNLSNLDTIPANLEVVKTCWINVKPEIDIALAEIG